MDMYDTSHRDQVLMMINYDSTTIEKQNMLPQCTVPRNGHGQKFGIHHGLENCGYGSIVRIA